MKRFALLALAAATIISGCRKIEVDGNGNGNNNGGGGGTTENLILSGKINTDRTLKSGNTYKLRGIVYVVDGAKLTIEPGVIIQGEKSSRGTLVITRGTQILAAEQLINQLYLPAMQQRQPWVTGAVLYSWPCKNKCKL